MKRRHLLFFLALGVFSTTIFFGLQILREKTKRVPEKRMWIQTLDTTNFFKAPWGAPVGFPAKNRGTATLACEKFLVRFEGESFLPDGIIGGGYQIDGRYGGLFSPDSTPFPVQENNGVTYSYDALTRTLLITYKTHRISYRNFENTLEIGGRKYATAPDFLALSVAKNGRAQTVRLPLEISVPDIMNSSSTWDRWPVMPR